MMDKPIALLGADPFPPYQYLDEDGKVHGSDFETVRELFEKAGYEINVTVDSWEKVIHRFETGSLDALFQVQKSPERERKYYFSNLLRNAVTEIITKENGPSITSLDEIPKSGLSLGVLEGYSYGEDIDDLPDSCKKIFETTEELIREVSDGNVEFGVVDRGVKEYLLDKMHIPIVSTLDSLRFERPLYIMFNDEALCEKIRECQTG